MAHAVDDPPGHPEPCQDQRCQGDPLISAHPGPYDDSVSRNSKIDAELNELYELVPDIPGCDGRCAQVCCVPPIEASDREAQRTPLGTGSVCAQLLGNRCVAYVNRPMLCRLWGTSEELPCPFGCKPTGRLTAEQEFALFVYSLAIGGGSNLGWPQSFDPERVMDAYRSDLNGVRTRFLTARAAARATVTSRAVGTSWQRNRT